MDNKKLARILENHMHWLNEDCEGWQNMRADLRGANLRGANLYGANLYGADLRGAEGAWRSLYCPCEGEFVAWKKARRENGDSCIVKLLIPADAKRLSATTEKCRADKAVVLEIQDMDGNVINECARSCYDYEFKYKVGETVIPKKPFDEDRWNECSRGIHFFIDKEMAKRY